MRYISITESLEATHISKKSLRECKMKENFKKVVAFLIRSSTMNFGSNTDIVFSFFKSFKSSSVIPYVTSSMRFVD
ncbi:hypothetical protein [Lactobacillus phage c5]|uniref:Uncharacterized protein n=1 Tax=Lactobacillus phage c5 TaxID=2892341 RepID=F8J178_9CAUD|nr:hypothetical protein F368_gp22 [Lactobacillus phage c5]ACA63316.1 hypothetical protein [Lactobacillus phage c5]